MTIKSIVCGVAAGLAIGFGVAATSRPNGSRSGVRLVDTPHEPTAVLAAAGRVEGREPASAVAAGVDGVLSAVLVREGDRVREGQIIARLDCLDAEALAQASFARERHATIARERLMRGGRDDARAEAQAHAQAAEARLETARLDHARMRQLLDEGVISQSEFDRADGHARSAEAEFEAARQHALVTRGEPLAEESALAEAAVASAKGDRRAADARLQKCTIRSPLDGVVLRRHLEPGERVSAAANTPIVTIADLSERRVRVEVDERDVAAVETGQLVALTADALGDKHVAGVVLRISSSMGRKRVRSGDPAEKADRDVLEVLVRVLENDPRLVVGLRVTAIFSVE